MWQGYTEKGNPVYYWWKCKLVQLLWNTVWRFPRRLKIGSSLVVQWLRFHASTKEGLGLIPEWGNKCVAWPKKNLKTTKRLKRDLPYDRITQLMDIYIPEFKKIYAH